MDLDAQRSGRFERVLDTIASRTGIFAVVGLLVGVCIGVGFYIHTVVEQLERDHEIFEDRQNRNGYVAMSDILRLIIVTQRAVEAETVTNELKKDFRDATDILFVRTDNFQRIMKRELMKIPSGVDAIKSLEAVVAIADEAIASDFVELEIVLEELLAANSIARTHLVQFLEDMRRQADSVLQNQSLAIRTQQKVVLANLVGLTLVGCVAMFLLRLEVLSRRKRSIAEQRVEFLAYFDPLTELPNRTQFQDRLRTALSRNRRQALLYLDLDDFKLINDTYGHGAGDRVLRHVAQIFANNAKEHSGFAARLGGDEFAIVLPTDDFELLNALCEKIIEDVAEPYWVDGESFQVGVSIGVATSTQARTQGKITMDMLSRVTDFALYTSKAEGRKRYTVYDHVIEQRFWDRRKMIDELPKAISDGALEVFLQPKVSLPSRAVYGFEALVRWRRGDKLVAPNDFIQIAEESGLVINIDHFVLRKASQLIADWNRAHGTQYSVSVNLSALHFNKPKIIRWVEDALKDAELEPGKLILEVTETTTMRDWQQAQKVLAKLKEVGCKISIDDFGTGFSSLAYLRMMKAHELKVDRSLVDEIDQSEKARLLLVSVMEIAKNLELEVTVEGIETEQQAAIVYRMGVGSVQGYLFGRPKPAALALEDAQALGMCLRSNRAS